MFDRDAAWASLHDPATDAATLAEVAAAYPEFAEAVARHPNAYPELIAWAAQLGAPEPAPTPTTPAPRRFPRWALIGGIAAAGVLVLGGVGWAAAALLPSLLGGGNGEPSAADGRPAGGGPAPARTLDGDPVYVGDELDWFLLSDDQRDTLSPGGPRIEKDASYLTSGESEGANTDVSSCIRWTLTGDDGIVGVRRATWQLNGVDERAIWSALQFPTVAQAQAYYRSFADTVAGCGRYQLLSGSTAYRTFTLELAAGSTDGTSFVVRESDVLHRDNRTGQKIRALAVDGNVVVQVSVPYYSAGQGDPAAYASVIDGLTSQARARLTEEIGYR